MFKRTQTKDVFDRVGESADDPIAKQTTTSESESSDTALPEESVSAATGSAGKPTVETLGESGDDHDIADGKRPGSPRRRVALTLVGVVLAAALSATAFLGWQLKQADDTVAAARAALDAARDYAVALTTLNTNDIDKNYEQALDGATGQFKNDYGQGSAQLRQILIDNKAAATGVVIDAAIKSATTSKVEVLLFVDQSVTNALNPSPRIDRNRVQMTMELVDNRWLASKVDII